MDSKVGLQIRIPQELLDRAEALVAPMDSDPAMSWGRVSRAAVIRAALAEGLRVLEERYSQVAPQAPRR